MIEVYRIQKTEYATKEAILSGKGAARIGGRWNRVDTPLIYTCSTLELAILEVLVHLEGTTFDDLPDFVRVRLALPNDSITDVQADTLPLDWNTIPYNTTTQDFTQDWLTDRNTLAMRVPSAVVPTSFNYLINPRHPLISTVEILDIQDFSFDNRLFK
jgi:RES domain-containing protein